MFSFIDVEGMVRSLNKVGVHAEIKGNHMIYDVEALKKLSDWELTPAIAYNKERLLMHEGDMEIVEEEW